MNLSLNATNSDVEGATQTKEPRNLGYTTSNVEDEGNNSESNFNSFNFSLNSSNLLVGLSYYF